VLFHKDCLEEGVQKSMLALVVMFEAMMISVIGKLTNYR